MLQAEAALEDLAEDLPEPHFEVRRPWLWVVLRWAFIGFSWLVVVGVIWGVWAAYRHFSRGS